MMQKNIWFHEISNIQAPAYGTIFYILSLHSKIISRGYCQEY